MRLILPLGVCLALASWCQADPKTDVDAIQGTWNVVSGERGGQAVPKEKLKGFRITIAGDKITIAFGSENKSGTFKLDAGKMPKHMDILIMGDDPKTAIYSLDKNQLRICFHKGMGNRPGEFKTTAGSDLALLFSSEPNREEPRT